MLSLCYTWSNFKPSLGSGIKKPPPTRELSWEWGYHRGSGDPTKQRRRQTVTVHEAAFLIIGIAIGVAVCAAIGTIKNRTQRALALREKRLQHEKEMTTRRARQLRAKLEHATGRNGWELDVDTVYSALFSENGFDSEGIGHLTDDAPEETETESR
jgi:hypothetical protein